MYLIFTLYQLSKLKASEAEMDIHTAANYHSNSRSKPSPPPNKVICKFYIPFEFPHASPPPFTQGRLKLWLSAIRKIQPKAVANDTKQTTTWYGGGLLPPLDC